MSPHLDCDSLSDSDLHNVASCTFWVEGVAMAVLGFVASLTNLISVYVFTRREMRNGFNALIAVLSAVDGVFCSLLVADYSLARAFELHTVLYTMLYPHLIYPVTNIMLSASIFMTVVLAIERYIAVCFPLVHRDIAHTYSVGRRVAAYTGPVVASAVIINVPKFLETQIVIETSLEHEQGRNRTINVTTYTIDVTELRDNPIYIKYYMNVTRTVLLGVAPFAALIFFNVKIYLRFLLTRGRYVRNNNNSSQAKDLQLAMLLVFIVCMFCVNNLPRLLLNLYELFHVDAIIECGKLFTPPVWFLCAASVNHLLLVLNCISNFFAYCFFNAAFRRVVVRLATGKAEPLPNSTCGQNSLATAQNAQNPQIAPTTTATTTVATAQQSTQALQRTQEHQEYQSTESKYIRWRRFSAIGICCFFVVNPAEPLSVRDTPFSTITESDACTNEEGKNKIVLCHCSKTDEDFVTHTLSSDVIITTAL